jgi:hypothetical protein
MEWRTRRKLEWVVVAMVCKLMMEIERREGYLLFLLGYDN